MNSIQEEKLVKFKTIINPQHYENLAILLLVIGFCMMSYFFM